MCMTFSFSPPPRYRPKARVRGCCCFPHLSTARCSMRRPTQVRGFTLIEVLTALVVGTIVLLGARALMTGLVDASRDIARVALESEARANADRSIRETFLQAEVGPRPEQEFDGNVTSLRFSTWCYSSSGWLERCVA